MEMGHKFGCRVDAVGDGRAPGTADSSKVSGSVCNQALQSCVESSHTKQPPRWHNGGTPAWQFQGWHG